MWMEREVGMSYDIYIGEAVIDVPSDVDADEYGCNEVRIRVEHITHPDAPAFPGDQMTGNGNSRHPAYAGWSDFCDAAGLHDLFFGSEDGLMREHPGAFLLRPKHLAAVIAARVKWQRENPTLPPGWGVGHDSTLARLLWLEFWIGWALENCKVPTIYNH